jgi:hypothetical protein
MLEPGAQQGRQEVREASSTGLLEVGLVALLLAATAGVVRAAPAATEWWRALLLPRTAGAAVVSEASYIYRPELDPTRALGPRRVGVQVGHWHTEQLPAELFRLAGSTGVIYGPYREVELNLQIATRVVAQLRQAGVEAELLPATVPAGYRADAFVAIHADGANRPGARGWKLAAAWRSSDASRALAAAVASTYAAFTGLPEDRYGTTYNMRGYYAFSPNRFRHALSLGTPAIILETGFLTSREDREVLLKNTAGVARGISAGIIRFLSAYDPLDRDALAVRSYPAMQVAAESARLLFEPEPGGRAAEQLPAGTVVRPVYRTDGWMEVLVWGSYRRFGWLPATALQPLGRS